MPIHHNVQLVRVFPYCSDVYRLHYNYKIEDQINECLQRIANYSLDISAESSRLNVASDQRMKKTQTHLYFDPSLQK